MKIALLGYDVENAGAYTYLKKKYPDARFVVYDQRSQPARDLPEGVEFIGNRADFKDIEADVSVRTPGIALSKIQVSGEITTATKLFFDACTAPIIGVTGTKGKGTTCTLIAKMLEAAGKKVHLVGNIGNAALDIVDDIQPGDIVVYELSSFQLWDLDKSPHIAVVLMIDAEHLDVHGGIKDYIQAKSNIVAHQGPDDIAIYYQANEVSRQIGESSNAQKLPFSVPDGDSVEINGQHIIKRGEIKLIGEHNLQNVYAAVLAAWHYTQDTDAIAGVLRSFSGLPHRLFYVAEVDGVQFYDDSISTTPASTIAALKSFDNPKVVILGGRSKGADFTELAKFIADQGDIKAILVGDEADNIQKSFDELGFTAYEKLLTADMKAMVARAKEMSVNGGMILLSPACSSVGMFKNYADRGDQFTAAVKEL